MRDETRAFMQAVDNATRLKTTQPSCPALMQECAEDVFTTLTLRNLFDTAKLVEDDEYITRVNELDSTIGALDRELRKLREQIDIVQQMKRQLRTVYARLEPLLSEAPPNGP